MHHPGLMYHQLWWFWPTPQRFPKQIQKWAQVSKKDIIRLKRLCRLFVTWLHLVSIQNPFITDITCFKELRKSQEYSVTSGLNCTERSFEGRKMPFPLLPCWCSILDLYHSPFQQGPLAEAKWPSHTWWCKRNFGCFPKLNLSVMSVNQRLGAVI